LSTTILTSKARCQCRREPDDDSWAYKYCLFCGLRLGSPGADAGPNEPQPHNAKFDTPRPKVRGRTELRAGLGILGLTLCAVDLSDTILRGTGVIDSLAFAAGYLVPLLAVAFVASLLLAKRWPRRFLIATGLAAAFACASQGLSLSDAHKLPSIGALAVWVGGLWAGIPPWVWVGMKAAGAICGLGGTLLILVGIGYLMDTLPWLEWVTDSLNDRAFHLASEIKEAIPKRILDLERRVVALEEQARQFGEAAGKLADVDNRIAGAVAAVVPIQRVTFLDLTIKQKFFETHGFSAEEVAGIAGTGPESPRVGNPLMSVSVTIQNWRSHKHFIVKDLRTGDERQWTEYASGDDLVRWLWQRTLPGEGNVCLWYDECQGGFRFEAINGRFGRRDTSWDLAKHPLAKPENVLVSIPLTGSSLERFAVPGEQYGCLAPWTKHRAPGSLRYQNEAQDATYRWELAIHNPAYFVQESASLI
jgi:hypothetical protein